MGCPQWAEPAWQGALYSSGAGADQRLVEYSRVFAAVEGNTTFYALPSVGTAQRWAELMPEDFHFCAKLPREVSHNGRLDAHSPELKNFFTRLAPLGERLGPIWLQLPARFAPAELDNLADFLDQLPSAFAYAVEVRHEGFFLKDEQEQRLNRLLHQRGVERIIFDSRALFSGPGDDPATQHARQRKPRLPVHAIALGNQPAVRFIGGMDNQRNLLSLRPWLGKCAQWLEQGLTPMLFMHTPDNRMAPELARLFHQQLREIVPDLQPMADWPGEIESASQPVQTGLF